MNYKKSSHILVMVPTYNEIDNIDIFVKRLISVRSSPMSGKFDVLFIDDNSPDGTGNELDLYSQQYDFISVIHRQKKAGIGTAHRVGISEAYNRGYTHLVTMDADFTHPPEFIPLLLEKSGLYDVVIGGRHAKKESLAGWSAWRKLLTFADHQFTLHWLYLPYDATSAFRIYRIDSIPHGIFTMAGSTGYSFFFEVLCLMNENDISIYDVPVILPPRSAGHSKLRFADMVNWVLTALSLGYRIRIHDKSLYIK